MESRVDGVPRSLDSCKAKSSCWKFEFIETAVLASSSCRGVVFWKSTDHGANRPPPLECRCCSRADTSQRMVVSCEGERCRILERVAEGQPAEMQQPRTFPRTLRAGPSNGVTDDHVLGRADAQPRVPHGAPVDRYNRRGDDRNCPAEDVEVAAQADSHAGRATIMNTSRRRISTGSLENESGQPARPQHRWPGKNLVEPNPNGLFDR